MVAGLRPRIVLGSAAAALALAAAGAHAAGNVAKITNTSARPSRFCAKTSDGCSHSGTTIRFTISTPAKVFADIRSRKSNSGGYVEFVHRFAAGPHQVRLNDTRLTPGRWTLKLLALNSVAMSSPANIDMYVLKSSP